MLALRLHVKEYKGGTCTVVGAFTDAKNLESSIRNLLLYVPELPAGLALTLAAHEVDTACKSKLLDAMSQRTLIAEVNYTVGTDEAPVEASTIKGTIKECLNMVGSVKMWFAYDYPSQYPMHDYVSRRDIRKRLTWNLLYEIMHAMRMESHKG